MLRRNQKLEAVKYFTAKVINNVSKRQKQNFYLEALQELTNVDIFFGRYQPNEINCNTCGACWSAPKEKKTDVNIATQMTADAFLDNFDDAILITRDSDLVPPVEMIKKHCTNKKIALAIAPGSISNELKQKVNYSFYMNKRIFRLSQLPEEVKKSNGYLIRKPQSWI